MKKIINLLFILLVFVFIGNLNVNAKDYAYCYYKYNTKSNNEEFPIKKRAIIGDWSNVDNDLIIVIQYNSETKPNPQIWAKLISKEKNISLNTTGDFEQAVNNSNIGFSIPSSARTPDYVFRDLPVVNIKQLQTNDNKMMCPNIYLYGQKNINQVNSTYTYYYLISLLVNEKTVLNEEYTYKQTLKPLSISKVSSGKIDNSTKLGCSYGVSFGSGFYSYNGTITFNVDNDGNVKQIGGTGDLETFDLTYTGDKLTQCPSYLKVNPNKYGGLQAEITVGTADDNNGVYNGDISTGEDNQNTDIKTIAKYYKYGENKKYIKIEKIAGNYNIKLDDDTNIFITNIDDYLEIIKSGGNSLPRYIIKPKGKSEYIFTDSVKNEDGIYIECDEIYINQASGLDGLGLSEEDIIQTCQELFGDNLLNFLDEYIFKAVWIGIPILLIILTSFDFAKVVFNDDKDGMPNAFKRFTTRAIVSVLLFLTPYIIILIANLVGAGDTVTSCAKKIRSMGQSSIIINNDLLIK